MYEGDNACMEFVENLLTQLIYYCFDSNHHTLCRCPELDACIRGFEETCPIKGGMTFSGGDTLSCDSGRCATDTPCEWSVGSAQYQAYYFTNLDGTATLPEGCTGITCTGCVASQSTSVSTAAASDINSVLGELLKCGGAGDMEAIRKCAVDVISQSDLDESTKKDLAACESKGDTMEMLACVNELESMLESAGGDPGGIVVTVDGELVVPGNREPEQFVKCQPWCSAIPNEWEEKCSWKFSCGECLECR